MLQPVDGSSALFLLERVGPPRVLCESHTCSVKYCLLQLRKDIFDMVPLAPDHSLDSHPFYWLMLMQTVQLKENTETKVGQTLFLSRLCLFLTVFGDSLRLDLKSKSKTE